MSGFSFQTRRKLAACAGAAFLFFIVIVTPHSVHHSFDHSQPVACQVFAVAKGCAVRPVSVTTFFFDRLIVANVFASSAVWTTRLLPAPASQRAPPVV